VIDEAVFHRLVTDLGSQHIGEVCRLFLENAAAEVDAVRQALGAGDAAGAAEAAHRLKSASGFLGATALAGLSAAVEAGSPASNVAEALADELRRTSADLDALVGRLARSTR
jgi:HPt (histidine-containing phosphotransfer) domain-containing protein